MSTTTATLASSLLMVLLYVARAVFSGDAADVATWNAYFLREHGLLDRGEAVLWLVALVLNAQILLALRRGSRRPLAVLWFLGMTALCVLALGEEVSWGQHLFGFKSETLAAVNAQSETNVHNLNLSLILGLAPSHPLYWWLGNLNRLLNPAFYLFACILWIGVPLAKRLGRFRLLDQIPTPRAAVSVFFAVNLVVYAVVDQLVIDVGELFEVALVITFVLGALDVLGAVRGPRRAPVAAPAALNEVPGTVR